MSIPDFDTNRFYLGQLCKNGHDWNNKGLSLRYKNEKRTCVICCKNSNDKRFAIRPGFYSKPREDIFWACVDRSNGEDECWNWKKPSNSSGGHCLFSSGNCRRIGAHRYSYILAYGSIPDKMFVCHKCDNPRCVNPKHLFLGTSQDNHRDMVVKERNARGEKHGLHKLTAQDVLEIRELVKKHHIPEIARKFNVTNECIYAIRDGKTWKKL